MELKIAEVLVRQNIKYDLIVDIQGDEPLISPYHIDKVVNFHKKNMDVDIVLPTLKIKFPDNPNIIKVVVNKKKKCSICLEIKYHLKLNLKVNLF